MLERRAQMQGCIVGAGLIAAVLGGFVLCEAADTSRRSPVPAAGDLSTGVTKKTPNKSVAQPTQRRQPNTRGTATVTPLETGTEETRPALPARDQGRGEPAATQMTVPASGETSHATPVYRYRPIDRDKATVTGQVSEGARAVLADSEGYPSLVERVAGMAPVIRMADQRGKPLPAAMLEQFIEFLERNEQLPAESSNSDLYKGNRVFFRGGYVGMMSDRKGEIFTDVRTGTNPADRGYYVGAGLDLLLARNLWGLLNGASAFGEINVEYKWLESARTLVAAPVLVGDATPDKVRVTMLTVSVAPKIKFNDGKAFRPWIIPAGLDVHVISPPSNRTQYLDVGVQFGAGFEYQVWREFKVGVEGRYHLAANHTQTVNSFWNAGPYVSIGF